MHRHSSMNRLYRLVWNDALMIWTAVAEVARGRGKSGTGRRRTAAFLALNAGFVLGPPALAGPNNINPDGRTQTTVSSIGHATDVHTTTTSGYNALNSFTTFGVGAGQVVNLHVPAQSANLVNLVTDRAVTVNGILNSIKNNQVGGRVFFASPNGFVVGTHGVVNVGSLTVSTPARSFLDTFFSSSGAVDAFSLGALLDGSAPQGNGSIDIKGQVNASGGVNFSSGSVQISGTVYRGAKFVGLASDFSDVVNVNGLPDGTKVIEEGGRIKVVAADTPEPAPAPIPESADETPSAPLVEPDSDSTTTAPLSVTAAPAAAPETEDNTGQVLIVATHDISVSGTIKNEGSMGVSGGLIDIRAGNNIALESGANISAAGRGASSDGGTVNIWADNDAVARQGALVDASAGSSGDGGFIEFSSKNTLELAGGEFRADGKAGGKGGAVLIDPLNILVSADILRGAGGYGTLPDGGTVAGANLTLLADNAITVNQNVTISTRSVAGTVSTRSVAGTAVGDHVAGASTQASGNLTLQAAIISLESGSQLLAGADSGFAGGDINIKATQAVVGVPTKGGGTSNITANGAIIRGRDITLSASSPYDDSASLISLPVTAPNATATVNLTDTEVTASGAINVGASTEITTNTLATSPLGTTVAHSTASVDIGGTSVLTSGGDTSLSASSQVNATVKPGGIPAIPLPADAAVAITTINSTSTVKVGGSSEVAASGSLALSATNEVTAETVADATSGGAAAVGGSVAVTVVTSVTKASIEDAAQTQSASLSVSADSKNSVINTAKAAAQGATKQTAADKTANPSETEKALDDYKEEGKTSAGSVGVAAAVAVASINSQVNAQISSSGPQTSTGLVNVSSLATSSSEVEADGSTVGDAASVGVGAAVAINVGVLNNAALIEDDTDVTGKGLTLSAGTHAGETNTFSTTSTSGAGASSVGVAGSLAVGTVVGNTTAALESGSTIDAGSGDVSIEADNNTSSTVTAGAAVVGTGDAAKLGVGASVGVNVGVNTTLAEVADGAALIGVDDMSLKAAAEHAMSTTVIGGASGANVAVTPVAAVTVGINSTTARLGYRSQLGLLGGFNAEAKQSSEQETLAKGATEGVGVAVGASIALGVADNTVLVEVERDISAASDVELKAISISKSDTSAEASAKGGKEADAEGDAPAGESVDEQVAAQGDAAKASGQATASKAGQDAADDKLEASKAEEAPKAETSEGGVSVAAAVGVNVASSETRASIGQGRSISSTGGALSVSSTAETDAKAKADGSQTDAGGTDVGIGAAVAVNAVTATNTALVSDGASVNTQGLTIKAGMDGAAKNDFAAKSKSGAGSGDVGVAGSLAINVVDTTTTALLQGDTDASGAGASVNAGTGAILIEAGNASTSTVKAEADFKGTGAAANVGVGASIGVNVVANKTVAEVADHAVVTGGANMAVSATAGHTMSTELMGGAAGAKTSITPVVAVAIAVNTTQSRVGTSATGLNLSGAFTSSAEQTNAMTTKATAQAQGDTAVGASLAAVIAVDDVSAALQRDIDSSTGVELIALSETSITTETTAGAKGAKKAKKNATTGEEEPEAGTTVDEQMKSQLDFAKSRLAAAAGVNTNTQEAKTPDTSTKTPGTDKPTEASEENRKDQDGSKISVAAAIGVGVARNQSRAEIGKNLNINAGTGELKLDAQSDTNYTTKSSGEAVSEDDAVSAAVAITATHNVTLATLGAGTTVTHAGDVNINAESRQNRDPAFQTKMSAEAVSGASGGGTAVAGGLALVVNENKTLASIDEGVTLGSAGNEVGHVSVTAEDTSKVSAQARAGALSKGGESKTGVGASFAVLVSLNENHAVVGRDADASDTFDATALNAESLTVGATKNRVSKPEAKNLTVDGVKNLDFDDFDPASYLASNNYYTEAIAGAASQGDSAIAGAFAVNVFTNKSIAELGEQVSVTTLGSTGPQSLGVDISSRSDMQSVSIAGAAAGAKQTGVGISNADTVNLDETRAAIGAGSTVLANGANAGVKVQAESLQEMTNVGVSAAASASDSAVAGVLGVVVALGKTEALVGDGAQVKAQGDVSLKARNDVTGVMVAGGVAASGQTGVGASISAHVLANSTTATIGDDAQVSSAKQLTVAAEAAQDVVSAVVAGAGAGTTAVAGALSVNVIVGDTVAMVNQGAQVNTDATYSSALQGVAITASDDTKLLAITGGGAGGGATGVGAALATDVMVKTVTAGIEDGPGTRVNAKKDVVIDASSSENLTSVTAGFAGGGTTGVGGAVSVAVVKNVVTAKIGDQVTVDADGNVGVNAQDDIKAILTAGAAAAGGSEGAAGSIGVATLLGTTKATIGESAVVNARGLGDARSVYTGETVDADTSIEPAELGAKKTEMAKGLSVTAYNRESLVATVASGAGGGSTGVAATVSADVIANTTEASIGRSARINETNASAHADQQVRVKAISETSLINTAGGAAGGGSAGVGAAANLGVITKTTTAKIGRNARVNAKKAVKVQAASLDSTLSTTFGLAGGGSVGVGGAVAGVGIANTTQALIEDGTSAANAAKINVTGGDLTVKAEEFANSWMISGGAAGGGTAGVGASLSVAVNASTTQAKIGDFAETNATGTTTVHADSTESVNTVTVAGSGGGTAGVSGSTAVNVVTSKTEAAIGNNTQINQDFAGQNVDVKATDLIQNLTVAGAAAGGGAAGVGGTVTVTVAQNTTQARIGSGAAVSATRDVSVDAASDKRVDSVAVAGAGGGAAGVAGAISIVSVGMLLDGDSKEGLGSTAADTDAQTTKSAVGDMLGDSDQSRATKADLDSTANKMAIGNALSDTAPVPAQNTTASIGDNATVKAGRDVTVAASDTTEVLQVAGGAAGGGAAGVAGTLGVTLLRDSAAATVGNGAQVDAGRTLDVNAKTHESILNIGVSAAGGGAAGVTGSVSINVIESETLAAIGSAQINQQPSTTGTQSVLVRAKSDTELITVAGSGGGGGAAAVGGVLNVNTLNKETTARIGEGARVKADQNVRVAADSQQQIIGAGISVQGSGAASVGGAAAVNVINNNTQAFIGSAKDDLTKTAAHIDSNGNVAISAADDTLLMGVSASVTGSGIAAVGGAAGVNVITSETLAYLGDDSSVNARGNDTAGAMVYNGDIDHTNARALPTAPEGKGDLDVDGDGVTDGNVSNGISFDVSAKGSEGKDASDTSNPTTTKDSEGNAIAGITGGLGTRATEQVKGFSVTAVSSEKIVTASLGVAAAGAAGVTGTVTANVISSVTDARIGDGAQVNMTNAAGAPVAAAANAVGADPSVRVRAASDTLVVMASGTLSAGIAAVSGSVNTVVVDKQTSATVGDADVKARDVDVRAQSSEDLFLATANVAVGAAGIGAAVGVASVGNTTTARIDAGANVDATRDLRVNADQDTDIDLYTLAGAGGATAVSGAVSVGVVNNNTSAYVEGASSPATAAVLNAGRTTEVAATSNAEMSSVTGSAAAGGQGVAGSVGVKVLTSSTTASIGNNTRVNQTRGGAAQDVKVSASDTVELTGGGLAGAVGGFGVGVMSDTNIVRNTTTASVGNNVLLDADRNVSVTASSSKNVESTAIAIAAGAGFGGAGSVSVAVIGASLNADAQEALGDGNTANRADEQSKKKDASAQLNKVSDSDHLNSAKSTTDSKADSLGVASDMKSSSVDSQDKTKAFVGNNSRVTAGGKVDVKASDKTQLDLEVVGAAGGAVGIGVAVGVGITNSTTEAFVGSSSAVDAVGDVTVQATAGNVEAAGSRVRSTAGAGGVIGVSAAVSVLKDSSTTRAYLGKNASIERADELMVNAETDRKAAATTLGAAAGGLAIGASVASATFGGSTSAYFESNVDVGKTAGKLVQDVTISAADGSVATASATAGAAGIASGSGAEALAEVTSGVSATLGSGAEVVAQDDVSVSAEATPETRAEALGVSIGSGSVGASVATASTTSNVQASVGAGASISGDKLDVVAQRLVGSKPTTAAQAFGASGGVLFGINATVAKADSRGTTRAAVGDNATLTMNGATTVHADSNTQQVSSGVGISVGGLLAVGAVKSEATSNTATEATLGNGVKLTGSSLNVLADGADTNFAHGIAGSGGLVSAPFSEAKTVSDSTTTARTGSGNNDAVNPRKIDVASLNVAAQHTGQFDAWMDSTNASLFGVSGAKATNTSKTNTEAAVGNNGFVQADSITVQAANTVKKGKPAGPNLPSITSVKGSPVAVPSWNVNSRSGGLADVPAADSLTTITNTAVAKVGDGATLQQTGSMLSPGAFKVDAVNEVEAKDRVKMASGGAISAASGSSKILADTNLAKVEVGDGAKLSATGDLMLGARSIADVSTQTSVDVWGLVGVAPKGDSVSRFKANNRIEVGSAELMAQNDIRLNAGASTQYNPATGSNTGLNQGVVTARTDVFNNTAIPVNRDPVADAIIETYSQITIDDGAVLNSVSDVALFAEKGEATASGVGVGKDIYREALAAVGSAISNAFGGGDVSFETRTGNSVKTQTSNVTMNGEIHVGINRKQRLEIDRNGNASFKTDGIDIAHTTVGSLAGDIISRIDALYELIRQYDGGADEATIAVAAYQSEIRFLQRKLFEIGFKLDEEGQVSFAGTASISPLAAAKAAVDGMTVTRTLYNTDVDTLTAATTALTADNTALAAANTTLVDQNTDLTSQNTQLSIVNARLEIDINVLNALISGSPASDTEDLKEERADKQGTFNTNNDTITTNETTITNNEKIITDNEKIITTNDSDIDVNTAEISRLNPLITSLDDQISSVQKDIDTGNFSTAVAPGPTATFLTISDTQAKLGNIYVRGDQLQGNGVLDAPGDAEIKITNNGPSFLVLNNLTIPADEGGRIYLNSVDVKNNAQINGINGAAAGANFNIFTTDSTTAFDGGTVVPGGKPQIVVESKYDPLNTLYSSQYVAGEAPPAPDIVVKGEISNLRGLVKIDSDAGSIRLEENASIRADTVEVKTRNGDFVQSYSDTFSHVAGNPLSTIPGDENLAFPSNIDRIQRGAQDGKGIIANGSVLLAARYLNINGTVQSGIPEWGVRIPANASVSVGGVNQTFDQARAHYNGLTSAQKAVLGSEYFQVSGATVSGLSGNLQGSWEDIKVNYNAKEDRLELSGVRVQGGYIEIFGQIFNTNQSGGGNLRVLDGYGQIKVDNDSSKAMWVNLLDTGKGVKGEINITNISGIAADGQPTITTTQFLRGDGAARTGYHYDPQAGLRYNMAVGYDTGRVDYYRYSQRGWFGGLILSESQLDQYRINSLVRSNDPLSQAEYLKVVAGDNSAVYSTPPVVPFVFEAGAITIRAITGGIQQTVDTATPITTNGRSWRNCNWWTLCAKATHYREFTITTSKKTTITDSMKADQRIGVEFIGFDRGRVFVDSLGSVVLNGAINNASGNTIIRSSGGSITQNGDLNTASGRSISLVAGTGIGTGTQAVQTNISDSGSLIATSISGQVHIKEMVGNLNVAGIGGAGVSNVVLEADGNIVNFSSGSWVQGQRVELLSNNGAIGTSDAPLTVRTGHTTNVSDWPNNGLKATARDSINIRNRSHTVKPEVYNGNLLLISAESKTGDVRIETSGAVIDNNPFETVDTRTQDELANLWDELRLRGAPSVEKANEAVAAFESGKTNNYRLYWQLRKGQADKGVVYNPGYVYAVTPGEETALTDAGLDADQIREFAQSRTDQYHSLHAEVGELTTSFDGGFAYNASAAEEAEIRTGSTWTDAQLALSVGAGLLKNITDTVTTIKEPNVKGNNIQLVAGTAIGSMNPNVVINLPTNAADITAFLNALTNEQKAALAAAERGDAAVTGNQISIIRPRSVNVETGTGALTASAAAGSAFIGSEKDLRINLVTASDDIRIKVAGALINAATVAGSNNVVGDNIILEAASGGIGAAGSAMRVNPTAGSSLIARAAGDIWLEAPANLTVDTIFSRNNVNLDVMGSILDMPGDSLVTPAVNIRSNNITLRSRNGSIGDDDNPLDLGVNAEGRIEATTDTVGQGIFLNGPSGERFNVGASTSGGATVLSAAEEVKIDGTVTGLGTISLVSGGQTTLTTQADVTSVAAAIQVRVGSLVMEDDDTDAARIRSSTGTIDIQTVGDALITGVETGNGTADAVRVVSTGGRVLDGGDTRLDVIANSDPAAKFTVAGLLGVGSDGNPLDVRVRDLNASSTQGSVAVSADGNVNIDSVVAGDAVALTASGNITGGSVSSTGLGDQGPVKNVQVTSTGGSVTLASVSGAEDVEMTALNDIEVTTTVAGGDVSVDSTAGQVLLSDVTAAGEIDVQGNTGVDVGTVESTGASVALSSETGDVKAGTTTAAQAVTMTALAGAITADNTTASAGDVGMTALNDIEVETVTAGVFSALSSGGNVTADTVNADEITMAAPGTVTGQTLNVGRNVRMAGQRLVANIQSTGFGDVGGAFSGFNGGQALDVQLQLNTPFAFRFTNLSSSTGNVGIPTGDLFVDSLWVSNRMTLSNPQTRVLVDQNDRTIQQPFDVQLFSAGAAFPFSLVRNQVNTAAQVIHRSPNHEVLSPNGNNISANELANREQSLVVGFVPLFSVEGTSLGDSSNQTSAPSDWALAGFDLGNSSNLVDILGAAVQTNEECKLGEGQGAGDINSKCKENEK